MAIIENQWGQIADAITLAVKLAAHFGFDEKSLTSTNAIIPIAYFLKSKKLDERILHAKDQASNRNSIKQWLIRALLKTIFGGTPDNLYPIYRQLIQENDEAFPLQQIIDRYSGTNKTLDFYQEDIESLLTVNYGSSFAFMLLSLFYPLNHDYEFHQDHIHPKNQFTNKRLEDLGITSTDTQEAFIERANRLPNLQLLQATPNMEKSGKMLKNWIASAYPNLNQCQQYKDMHLIPTSQSLDFENFLEFYDAREKLIRNRLYEILNVKKPPLSVESTNS
jgi:hypothetical protein